MRMALFGRGDLRQFARDEKVVGPAEQALLLLRHLARSGPPVVGHAAAFGDELFHPSRFGGGNLVVGVRNAAQDEGERGQVSGLRGIQAVELGRNPADGVAVGGLVG